MYKVNMLGCEKRVVDIVRYMEVPIRMVVIIDKEHSFNIIVNLLYNDSKKYNVFMGFEYNRDEYYVGGTENPSYDPEEDLTISVAKHLEQKRIYEIDDKAIDNIISQLQEKIIKVKEEFEIQES